MEWRDGTLLREGWSARYSHGGARLRSAPAPDALVQRFAACWIAQEEVDSYEPADAETRRVIALVRKILQRGSAPPLHPDAERALLDFVGRNEDVRSSDMRGDAGPSLRNPPEPRADEHRGSFGPAHPVTAADLPYDSEEERRFHQEWLPAAVGPVWPEYVIPQASLDLLLSGSGARPSAYRRVDFLVSAPWTTPFVVEIDGDQHSAQAHIDEQRDRALADAGYPVVRVPVEELTRGSGPQLDQVRSLCPAPPEGPISELHTMLRLASQVHRCTLALLDALAAGFVAGERWVIELRSDVAGVEHLLTPYLDVLDAASRLWGDDNLAPRIIQIHSDDEVHTFERADSGYARSDLESRFEPDVVIHLQSERTPVADLPVRDGRVPQIVVRSAHLPVAIRDVAWEGGERVPVVAPQEVALQALTTMLRAVFAKQDFRPGQAEAVLEVLSGRDCVVLLPTGAGKSLIYQLAGLCMPGRTLVIDPLVALIEDQVEGLARNGIDRVCWITSSRVAAHGSDDLLDEVESADALFMLVSPERLQTERFRQALATLSAQTHINMAVVDEAHCVSEWGHQFRTSYLRLGATIGITCKDAAGARPPILALTGTASRAVLRDVLHELEIVERTEHTLIRPPTLDREELTYRVKVASPSEAEGVLEATIRSLPGELGIPAARFFAPRGSRTASGIVFCQTVNGNKGVVKTAERLAQTLGAPVATFSGRAPTGRDPRDWDHEKGLNARRFKANEAPVLVSTNAFGMGIDKPNIRWVVHYGLPTSIEAYYQEVGRAGRDGRPAVCVLVFAELDESRSRTLLSEELGLEEARGQTEQIGSWDERDDITTALYFHLTSFPGARAELEALLAAAELLEPGERSRVVQIPFGAADDQKAARERALHRLVILGVVREYLVDWGSRKFTVFVNQTSAAQIRDSLVRFVGRSQPGRVEAVRASLAEVDGKPVPAAIATCGAALIDFVYDTIERSRRRSLREMWAAVKTSSTDRELRQRVLDYLAEGDVAPILNRLIDARRIDLTAWFEAMGRIETTPDAREWRGTTARLLASYPDHPMLLLARGVVELADPDGELDDFSSNAESALATAERYALTDDDVEKLLRWTADFADRWSGRALAAAIAFIAQTVHANQVLPELFSGNSLRHWDAPGVAAIRVRWSLDRAVADVQDMVELVRGRYE